MPKPYFTQIIRTNPLTGALERPWRQRDGQFMLGDPAHGATRHHKDNAVFVASYSEALELVRKGYSIRMSDGRSSASLVAPGSLTFIDKPVEHIDDLWAYTMPELPFTLESVLQDLRCLILSQAADLALIAHDEAATAFIGFAFNADEDSESTDARARIDLDRFNITRIVRAAYASAFRPWPSASISEEDVDELEQIVKASITRHGRRHPSPLDDEKSPLHRTLMSAYFRWQISEGSFLDKETLDDNATTAIGILTGMPATTVRNSLSREGISTVKAKLDQSALIEWTVTRRNFTPLREEEQPASRWTGRAIHNLKHSPLPRAFDIIREMMNASGLATKAAEDAICAAREQGRMPLDADLRAYAAACGLLPDSLILAMRAHWAA